MTYHKISITINGGLEEVVVPSNMTLLRMLRETLALTGTKNGCSAGECGACTVLLNGEPVNSCMVLAVECDGAVVVTVEGLAQEKELEKFFGLILTNNKKMISLCRKLGFSVEHLPDGLSKAELRLR